MKKLLILGTGVHALEMAEIIERVNTVKKKWNLVGFVSENDQDVGKILNGYPVICSQESLPEHTKEFFIPDNNNWYRPLNIPRERFATIVDPSTFVSRTASIGSGCVIFPNCYVGLNARIGDFVFCLSASVINHDDVIEDGVIIASGVTLAGSLRIETGCYLGQSCSVRQFLTVGKNSLVGMGSVVVKAVPPNSVMAGNPAKKIKDR